MEWIAQTEEVQPGKVWKFSLTAASAPQRKLTFAEVADLWAKNKGFVLWFSALLAGHTSAAFRFETPAVTFDTMNRVFEFVLVDSPALAGSSADMTPFTGPLAAADAQASVVCFSNLSGDAEMVVPRPGPNGTEYPHLAAFVRSAPQQQQQALWQTASLALRRRLGPQPLWLNTAGLGVSWLHVRLDSLPKYYSFKPYKAPQG